MSMDVSSTTYVPNSNSYANSRLIERAGGATETVGAGTAAGVGMAPDAVPGLSFGVLMASLGPIMPRISGDQLDALVASFTAKAKDVSDASDRDQIKTQQAAKSAALKEKKANADEAIKKQAEAEDKIKGASVWDKIKLAFEYVGALLTIAAGVATILAGCFAAETGVGLAAGIIGGSCMIASGVCMLTMAVDSTVQIAQEDQGKGDLGMFGKMCKDIAKSRGLSEEDAEAVGQKGAMGASISLGAISAAFGLASAAAGGAQSIATAVGQIGTTLMNLGEQAGQAATMADKVVSFVELGLTVAKDAVEEGLSAAKEGIKEALSAAKEGLQEGLGAAKEAASAPVTTLKDAAGAAKEGLKESLGTVKAKEIAKVVSSVTTKFTEISGDVSNIGSAAANVGSTVTHYQATGLQADAKHAQANTKRFQALQQAFDDAIDLAMSHLKASGQAFDQILDNIVEGMNDRNDTLTHMQFRA